MRTCLVTPCHLTGHDEFGNNRLMRNLRYFRYYQKIKHLIGYEKVVFIDNASRAEELSILEDEIGNDGAVLRYPELLEKDSKRLYDYPYVWRALYTWKDVMDTLGFEKIISIDSDSFVLTARLAETLRTLQSGWSTLWCRKYEFPEASCQVLCPDTRFLFDKYTAAKTWAERNGSVMERSLPFTQILDHFNASRWGEDATHQKPWMDFYAQASLDQKLIFNMKRELFT